MCLNCFIILQHGVEAWTEHTHKSLLVLKSFGEKTPKKINVSRVSVSTFTPFLGNCSVQSAGYILIIMRTPICLLHVQYNELHRR